MIQTTISLLSEDFMSLESRPLLIQQKCCPYDFRIRSVTSYIHVMSAEVEAHNALAYSVTGFS